MKINNVSKNPILIFFIILVLMLSFIAVIYIKGISVNLNDNGFTINSSSYNKEFKYTEIESVELLDNVDYGTRTFGLNAIVLQIGNYKNNDFGNYQLAVYKNNDSSIKLTTKASEIIVFNIKSKDDTKKLFEELKSKI